MPQAVQIETQAEQQGLAHLHGQAAAWGSPRELAFDRREYALDQRTAPVDAGRKCSAHLRAHATHAPSFLPTLGGNHTVCAKLLSNVGVVRFAVEFRVGQHPSNPCLLGSGLDHGGQIRAVVPGTPSRGLRQQELLIQIRHGSGFCP